MHSIPQISLQPSLQPGRRAATRRLLSAVGAAVALSALSLLSACSAAPLAQAAIRSFSITPAQLQQALTGRFPHTQRLGEVLELQVLAPRLSLLPASNRLGTELDMQLTERLTGGQYKGSLAVDYGLRFEPNDNSLRMTGLAVRRVSIAGLAEPYQALLGRQVPRVLERLLDDYPLHRFADKDLALLSGLGLMPGAIKVTPNGLTVGLQPRPLTRP